MSRKKVGFTTGPTLGKTEEKVNRTGNNRLKE